MNDQIDTERKVNQVRMRLLNHPMYYNLKNEDNIRLFMEHHVFAVWDFMSLLKALQKQLTCVEVPWVPKGNYQIRHMINEIVLGEETDEACGGKSHFEWYLEAMTLAGADTQPIHTFLEKVQSDSIETALETSDLPLGVKQFVGFTFETIASGEAHRIAAAFTAGRENLIPGMFPLLVAQTQKPTFGSFKMLSDYLERHIEVDGDDHGPLAEKMQNLLCEGDPQKISEARVTALRALEARDGLWNGVLQSLKNVPTRRAS